MTHGGCSDGDDTDSPSLGANLSADLLREILVRVSTMKDLGRAGCVSRGWLAVATDAGVRAQCFGSRWGLSRLVGTPSSDAFWRLPNTLNRFALSHALSSSDTIPSLALRYNVQVRDIKRMNNMMSDHGIYSRERLIIPINNANILVGSTGYIEMDKHAKREVVVLYLDGKPPVKADSHITRSTTSRQKRNIVDSVSRSLRVDNATAEYYLLIADGNPRTAMLQFSEDLLWEQQRST